MEGMIHLSCSVDSERFYFQGHRSYTWCTTLNSFEILRDRQLFWKMDLTLDDLVQESEKLLMDVQEDNDLPHITRSLDQMRHLGEKLYLSRGSNSDVKAARLLGPKMSYELPQNLTTKLENLVPTDVYDMCPVVPKTDIQSFLRSERDNALLTAILMTRKSVGHADQFPLLWYIV